MTLFEYLAVAFSFVLGFSLTHLLGSVRSVFGPERRNSIHIGFFFYLILFHPYPNCQRVWIVDKQKV